MSATEAHRSVGSQQRRPKFGIDNPITILELLIAAGASIGIGVFVLESNFGANELYSRAAFGVGVLFGALLVGLAGSLTFTSVVAKPREASELVRNIPWGGNEIVLDVGSGRGPVAIRAGRALSKGIVVALDTWSPHHVTGSSPSSLMSNADLLGVRSHVAPVRASPLALPFPEGTFDVVTSCLGLSYGREEDWEAAIGQLVQSLKSGGRLSMLVVHQTGFLAKMSDEDVITDFKVSGVRFGVYPVARRVSARKPTIQRKGRRRKEAGV